MTLKVSQTPHHYKNVIFKWNLCYEKKNKMYVQWGGGLYPYSPPPLFHRHCHNLIRYLQQLLSQIGSWCQFHKIPCKNNNNKNFIVWLEKNMNKLLSWAEDCERWRIVIHIKNCNDKNCLKNTKNSRKWNKICVKIRTYFKMLLIIK